MTMPMICRTLSSLLLAAFGNIVGSGTGSAGGLLAVRSEREGMTPSVAISLYAKVRTWHNATAGHDDYCTTDLSCKGS